ncbi:helix-turn-helix transcriptional regulator [Chitinophaga sp. OAE865]|uniref:helix-turn-helix domain-containing protein n=1 Tax=Chitinophaga sp. OAE865 TaxID=2817898 RepID=UPI001AE7DA49
MEETNEMELLKQLGENLRRTREGKKFTLLQIEAWSGIDKSDVSKIERGIINPTYTTLIKLSEALEVPLYKILSME